MPSRRPLASPAPRLAQGSLDVGPWSPETVPVTARCRRHVRRRGPGPGLGFRRRLGLRLVHAGTVAPEGARTETPTLFLGAGSKHAARKASNGADCSDRGRKAAREFDVRDPPG